MTSKKGGGKKKTTKTDMLAESRTSGERIPVNLLVDYQSKEGHYLFDFCKDLGTGGIFIQTERPLGQGEELELTFTIPDSKKTLAAKGKVMWVQQRIKDRPELTAGMGVQFMNFAKEQRTQLEEYIKRYNTNYKSIFRAAKQTA